jgi:FkbM family methyltransferase
MSIRSLARIWRKTFLTRSGEHHYSQYGEDCVLLSWFSKQRQELFFVDVGSYHPTKGSNTYALYRRGWRGINIDLDPDKISAFNMRRPGDVNIVAAVSDRRETLNVFSDKWYSMRATLDQTIANSSGFQQDSQVETTTLTEIIDSTRYRGRSIDLLSVDVEGFDLRVLNGLDFSRYAPHVILVETHLTTIGEILSSELHESLTTRGYSLANWVGLTLFYRQKS